MMVKMEQCHECYCHYVIEVRGRTYSPCGHTFCLPCSISHLHNRIQGCPACPSEAKRGHPPPQRPGQTCNSPQRPTQGYNSPQRPTQGYNPPQRPTQGYNSPQRPMQIYNSPQRPTQIYNSPQRLTQGYNPPQRPMHGFNFPRPLTPHQDVPRSRIPPPPLSAVNRNTPQRPHVTPKTQTPYNRSPAMGGPATPRQGGQGARAVPGVHNVSVFPCPYNREREGGQVMPRDLRKEGVKKKDVARAAPETFQEKKIFYERMDQKPSQTASRAYDRSTSHRPERSPSGDMKKKRSMSTGSRLHKAHEEEDALKTHQLKVRSQERLHHQPPPVSSLTQSSRALSSSKDLSRVGLSGERDIPSPPRDGDPHFTPYPSATTHARKAAATSPHARSPSQLPSVHAPRSPAHEKAQRKHFEYGCDGERMGAAITTPRRQNDIGPFLRHQDTPSAVSDHQESSAAFSQHQKAPDAFIHNQEDNGAILNHQEAIGTVPDHRERSATFPRLPKETGSVPHQETAGTALHHQDTTTTSTFPRHKDISYIAKLPPHQSGLYEAKLLHLNNSHSLQLPQDNHMGMERKEEEEDKKKKKKKRKGQEEEEEEEREEGEGKGDEEEKEKTALIELLGEEVLRLSSANKVLLNDLEQSKKEAKEAKEQCQSLEVDNARLRSSLALSENKKHDAEATAQQQSSEIQRLQKKISIMETKTARLEALLKEGNETRPGASNAERKGESVPSSGVVAVNSSSLPVLAAGERMAALPETPLQRKNDNQVLWTPNGENTQDTEQVESSGLPNLGNTCYINSVLQCLFHVPPLREYLLQGQHRNDLNVGGEQGGEVAVALAEVFQMMERADRPYLVMKRFKEVLESNDDLFKGYQQQEAHDLLAALLAWLHSDLIRDPNERVSLQAATPESETSFISSLFYGEQESAITCPSARKVICTTPESFSSLSLAVVGEQETSLEELLGQHFRSQSLEWECEECRRVHVCDHKTLLTRAPKVLVLYLSRYSYNTTPGHYTTHKSRVIFPAADFTLQEYMVRQGTVLSPEYRLVGVVNHHGTMRSGHYTAYCKGRGGDGAWWLWDDMEVYQAGQAKVLNQRSAHILFYLATEESSV